MSGCGCGFLKELGERRRFGMKPGLDTIRGLCAALGDPHRRLGSVVHVAGTNGKGAVCAILDSVLGGARYTSPHLVRLNERFFLHGLPIADEPLEAAAAKVSRLAPPDLTFFEALTAVAFDVFAEARPGWTVLETGLGGRLDATNVCEPRLAVITGIGLDHCDWLGDTVEKIASEKAGIVKPGVPVVLARNAPSVIEVIRRAAAEKGSPFFYAPDLATEAEIPEDFSLAGSFNRENCVTALAALKILRDLPDTGSAPVRIPSSLSRVVWPGRFQRIGDVIVDGAHNPPAARALAEALSGLRSSTASPALSLIAGFCGDKDALEVLKLLRPQVSCGYAVRTDNPRSLSAEATAALMSEAGIRAVPCGSLREALSRAGRHSGRDSGASPSVLVCGSLFLAGEAIVELGAYPWGTARFDPSELLKSGLRPETNT